MIKEVLNKNEGIALTSDQWHVLHARWVGNLDGEPRFEREIVSEHADRRAAIQSAKRFGRMNPPAEGERPRDARDQILVRRPDTNSPKIAGARPPRAE